MEVFRRQDAEQGMRVAQVLEGFISRKVVKQTVMTVVYGVTRYGGRLQIEKRLRELSDFPQVCTFTLNPSYRVSWAVACGRQQLWLRGSLPLSGMGGGTHRREPSPWPVGYGLQEIETAL